MKWADIAERTTWTILQSGVAVALVEAMHLSVPLTVLISGVLALAKTYISTRASSGGSAATLPPAIAPVAPQAISEPPVLPSAV